MDQGPPTTLATAAEEDALDAATAGTTAIRGSALRSGAYVAGVLLSLISAPLIIRHLGVDDFGVYVTIIALVTAVSGISDLGLTSLGVREWAQRSPSERRTLMRDLLGARLVFTGLGVAGAFAFALAAGYGAERMAATALASATMLMQALQSALTVPLAGRLRQGRIGAADLLRQLVQVTLVVVLVSLGAGLVWLVAAGIPAALASLLFTAISARDGFVLPSIRPARWRELLRGTLAFAAASGVSVVYLRATVVLTSLVATPAQNGQFAIAFRVLEVLINVPALLVGALFPLLSRAAASDPARLRGSLERTWQAALALGGLAAVAVSTAAPLAVLVLSGSRPAGAVDALRILGPALGCSFIGAACQYGLLALHEHRAILTINLAALTTNVVLTLLLARHHGAVGSATALGCSELLVAVWATVLLRRHAGPLTLGLELPVRVAVVVAVGAAAALVLAPLGVVVAGLAAPALALGAALAVRAIPHEIWAALPRPGRAA